MTLTYTVYLSVKTALSAEFAEADQKPALSSCTGEIVGIGAAFVCGGSPAEYSVFTRPETTNPERDLLRLFWLKLAGWVPVAGTPVKHTVVWDAKDLKFLLQRSWLLGITPTACWFPMMLDVDFNKSSRYDTVDSRGLHIMCQTSDVKQISMAWDGRRYNYGLQLCHLVKAAGSRLALPDIPLSYAYQGNSEDMVAMSDDVYSLAKHLVLGENDWGKLAADKTGLLAQTLAAETYYIMQLDKGLYI